MTFRRVTVVAGVILTGMAAGVGADAATEPCERPIWSRSMCIPQGWNGASELERESALERLLADLLGSVPIEVWS